MIAKALLFVMMVGVTLANPWEASYQQHQHRPQPYSFGYKVQDGYGQNHGRQESSDGKTVVGAYSVDLPDGRVQTVEYRADPYSGFQADVKFSGQAHHSSSHHGHHQGANKYPSRPHY